MLSKKPLIFTFFIPEFCVKKSLYSITVISPNSNYRFIGEYPRPIVHTLTDCGFIHLLTVGQHNEFIHLLKVGQHIEFIHLLTMGQHIEFIHLLTVVQHIEFFLFSWSNSPMRKWNSFVFGGMKMTMLQKHAIYRNAY